MASKKQKTDFAKLTILVASCIETGHLNALTGETLALKRRGHRVIFALPDVFQGKLAKFGFEEYIYSSSRPVSEPSKDDPKEDPSTNIDSKPVASEDVKSEPKAKPNPVQDMYDIKLIGPYGPKEKLGGFIGVIDSEWYIGEYQQTNRGIKEAIDKFTPDVIIVDAHSLHPSVYYSGIPWIKSCSMAAPMEVWFDDVPPGGSGMYWAGP